MLEKSWIMLRVLMNQFHEGGASSFLEGMNQEDQQALLDQDVDSADITACLASPGDFIEKVHYSWLAQNLENFPKGLNLLALSAFSEKKQSKLRSILKSKPVALKISESVKSYVLAQVFAEMGLNNVLPREYLPESPLKILVTLKKRELVDLIDFLGLYDLSEEVRRIVDTKRLQQIYETLTRKKHDYMRQCMKSREKLVTSKLNLDQWDGDHEKLNKILHHRGMVRLGYALSGTHPDMIWYVTHTLDTGRGQKLMEFINENKISGVTDSVTKQVLNVIQFFKEPQGVKL